MKKQQLGNTAVLILIGLYGLLWLITLPEIIEEEGLRHPLGEILAGTAMICMSIGLILAVRLRFLEDYFGGLDKMYVTHRWVNTTAILLLMIHGTLFFHFPPDQPGLILGVISMWGLVILVALSLAPRIPVLKKFLRLPYVIWHYSHRLIGVFFIVGLVHYLFVEPISAAYPQGALMFVLSILGIVAYVYKQLIGRTYWLGQPYEITAVNPLNSSTLEVVMKPLKQKIDHMAGQFLFVQFADGGMALAEPHPFTISSAPNADQLRLSIKGSGDWTSSLKEKLKVGGKAKVQGGYGRFNYKSGGQNQLWIAGGIGVTPFLSWIRDLDGNLQKNVDFYYCVRGKEDALFWEEIQRAVIENETLDGRLHMSQQNGRLTASTIAEQIKTDIKSKEIYMCGPAAMIESYTQQFKSLGVPASQIHYEEFNFR